MMWLTWRQFRAQTITAAAALAVAAIALAATGPHLASLYATSGIPACHAHGDCDTLASNFVSQLKSGTTYAILFYLGIGLLFLAPTIIGVFWGAPLVTREIEAGTLRLAWGQSVTRTRWLTIKLGLIGLAAMAAAGLLSLMITWWASPIDRTIGIAGGSRATAFYRLDPLLFAARGITPVGYAAFAFALGVTAGVLIRRTLPAMAVTLAVFALVQIAMPSWIRPHLITPVRTAVALNPANINGLMINNNVLTVMAGANEPGAWVLSNQTITPAGHVFTGPPTAACQSQTASFQACQASLGRLHLRQLLTYQPASRYWAFQWYETAIFLVLAVALAGFCFSRIRRRRLS
jgi:ABC-type transport system involved in multi-copper enzyme maturation permease subunit